MNRIRLMMAVLMFIVLSACAGGEVNKTPSLPMQTAPDFTLPDQTQTLMNEIDRHLK